MRTDQWIDKAILERAETCSYRELARYKRSNSDCTLISPRYRHTSYGQHLRGPVWPRASYCAKRYTRYVWYILLNPKHGCHSFPNCPSSCHSARASVARFARCCREDSQDHQRSSRRRGQTCGLPRMLDPWSVIIMRYCVTLPILIRFL